MIYNEVIVQEPIVEEEVEIEVYEPVFGPNVTAYIDKISIFGDMTIKFNASMFTTFNFSMMNSSFIDLYIVPFDPSEDFNFSTTNFTWNLTYYEVDEMIVKIDFDNSSAISLNLE